MRRCGVRCAGRWARRGIAWCSSSVTGPWYATARDALEIRGLDAVF
ncbi:hypothetical protein [Falsiroseomonas oryzae]|nr:hypothetical protein [Roseomonas sp. MO-31]